ncbi:MAG: hypothetical protein GXO90_10595 [FCB group bacterium]|nr:hypothetical protein [FCB group bacterium]
MKFKQTLIAMTTLILVGSIALGGNKPLRMELKVGSPNLVGGSVEYLLPDVGIKGLAPYLDVSAFTLSLDETTDMGYTYWSVGSRYYLDDLIGKKGYFVGAGLGRFTITLTDNEWYNYDFTQSGTAEGSVGVTMFQIKLGKRFFLGPFTLGLETGYSMGKMDDVIKIDVKYPDGTTDSDEEDTSDIPISSGAMGAISIGIAF